MNNNYVFVESLVSLETKIKEVFFAMEDIANKEVTEEPPEDLRLLPCYVCNRTFLPEPLKKHRRICEQVAHKKRKPFDSLKQRLEGTDLAPFIQSNNLKKNFPDKNSQSQYGNNKQSKWKEKHMELVDTIRKAKVHSPKMRHNSDLGESKSSSFSGASSEKNAIPTRGITPTRKVSHAASSQTSVNERCPSCDRAFGPKAFDRHVEWCKERQCRIQKSPANIQQAKERLEARIKYRVPPLKQSQRSIVREKYSPTPQKNTPILRRSNTITSVKSTTSIGSRSTASLNGRQKKYVNKSDKDVGAAKGRNNQVYESRFDNAIGDCADNKQKVDLKAGKTVSSPSYDPIELAQRQLAELLDGDDANVEWSPLLYPQGNTSTTIKERNSRPFTIPGSTFVLTTPKKTANSSRDKVNISEREFLLLENLLNNNILNECSDKLFRDFENLEDVNGDRTRYSDDISSIDPSLINERDDLSIPENLENSSSSTTDSEITIRNNPFLDSIGGSVSLLRDRDGFRTSSRKTSENSSPKQVIPTINLCKIRSSPDGSSADGEYTNNSKMLAKLESSHNKDKLEIDSSVGRAGDKVKRAGRNKLSDFEHKKKMSNKNQKFQEADPLEQDIICSTESLKAEDLFSVDNETYEEYKKYEEIYLKEKSERSSHRKCKNKPADFGIVISNNKTEQIDRSVYKKHKPKEQKRIAEEFQSPQLNLGERVSKYCHECGNKYPVTSAKFCVECGVKRLIL